MITGFLYGVAAAFFWSLTNIVDKYLTKRHAEDGNIWGILVLSCFFPAVLLPIAAYFSPIAAPRESIAILMLAGGLMVAWIYFYLKALTEDDTSVVMTLLVLAPFFSLVFSNLILGETLTTIQMLAGGLLVLGSLTVSYSPSKGNFNLKLIFYAVAASTVMGLMHTLFKFSTVGEEFWRSMFWRSAGMVVVGLLLCFLVRSIRERFLHFVHNHLHTGLTLNTTNESLTLLGDTIFGFAILLAPIALVQTTESYQPIFIIVISFVLAQLGFTSVEEDNSTRVLIQKGLGILFVIVGSTILVLNS
jgi:uncharacterized membrane protein